MREIEFRGKSKDPGFMKGQWIYGYYWKEFDDRVFIGTDAGGEWDYQKYRTIIEVIPETVGQYTGLKDKNGKKIYEGDVHEYNGKRFPVAFGTFIDEEFGDELYGWYLGDANDATRLDEQSDKYVNIIGNIHEEVQE